MSNSGEVAIKVEWAINPLELPAPVNQIMVQQGASTERGTLSGEYFLNFGHVSPPMLDLENPDVEMVNNGVRIPVVPAGRFAITWERLVEFNDVLTRYIEMIRAQSESANTAGL